MPTIDIDYKNYIAGEGQTDAIADRGFSPDSFGLNLTKSRGKLHFIGDPVDRGSTTLQGNILASCIDTDYLGNDVYYVDDDGSFYAYNANKLTKKQSSGHAYTLGTSDMISFLGKVYATSQYAIVELTSNMAAINDEWWVGLDTSYRHPLERVESEMFIGNKNVIYYWNGTSSGTAFTLPTDVNVTSLRKHPDGRTLLAFCGINPNFSHDVNTGGRVYFCDPVIRDWTREVELESQVEGTRVSGGVVYVTYGMNFGYFNGSGLSFIKKLQTSTTTYSQCMTNMDDILMVRDGTNVLCFGNLGAGMVWWNCFRNLDTSTDINNIAYEGENSLMVAYSNGAGGGSLKEIDFDSVGYVGKFYSNRISFGSTVKIRRIDLVHDLTDSGGTTNMVYNYRDPYATSSLPNGTEYLIENKVYPSATGQTRIHCDITTDVFQFVIDPESDDIGIRLIRIYYDPIK